MTTHAVPIAVPLARPHASQPTSAVAVFDTHSDAERAIQTLAKSGFDMSKLSIVGQDYSTNEGVIGYYNAGDRVKAWGKRGAFWGGLWGMLFGSALFVIPGVGPLFAAGPVVAWIVAGLEGATVVGGLSAVGAALYGLGIPKDSVIRYETEIKAGKFVVVAHGTTDEIARSRTVLSGADVHAGVVNP